MKENRMKNVLLLFGGASTEHMVSCRSALNISSALKAAGYSVHKLGITMDGRWLRFPYPDEELLRPDWAELALEHPENQTAAPADILSPRDFVLARAGFVPDIIYPAVHGINCEDGVLQGLLDMTGIPYVGSKVAGSAVAMDKILTKQVLQTAGIPVVPYAVVYREDILSQPEQAAANCLKELGGLPCFLKPANGGSSVGTLPAETLPELVAGLKAVSVYDHRILVERLLEKRELEVAVLGNQQPVAAAPGEIVMQDQAGFYDYRTKYFSEDGSYCQIPAELDPAILEQLQAYALRAFRLLDLSGLARVDFFVDRHDDRIFLNEINNLPGFTPISLYPQAFAQAGLSMAELVTRLCELAEADFVQRRRQVEAG